MSTPDANDGGTILDVQNITKWIFTATSIIITLGILAESYVYGFGSETRLQNLGRIALNDEGTLAVWYSSALMIACAAVAILVSRVESLRKTTSKLHWLLLGIVFVCLSIDETVSIHEITIIPLRNYFGLSGVLHFSWVIIAGPLLALFALFFLPFLLRLPRAYAALFILSGGIYTAGALGMVLAGGHLITSYGEASPQYIAGFLIEESMELIGLSLFLASLLDYLAKGLREKAVPLRLR